MELILLTDVEQVGRRGDVIRVKEGFGRNFLLPRGLALVSSERNKKFVDELKARAAKRHARNVAEAKKQAEQLKSLKINIEATSGEQGKLYGSVTSEDIRQALQDKGYAFDKKQIHVAESIRTLGVHEFVVEVYPQVKATMTLEVIPKSE